MSDVRLIGIVIYFILRAPVITDIFTGLIGVCAWPSSVVMLATTPSNA